jgi:hypothetical protein
LEAAVPLLDHFRLPRLGGRPSPPPLVDAQTGAAGRLHRVVVRQKTVRVASDLDRRLQALEGECSEPLYDSSAYGSPAGDAPER